MAGVVRAPPSRSALEALRNAPGCRFRESGVPRARLRHFRASLGSASGEEFNEIVAALRADRASFLLIRSDDARRAHHSHRAGKPGANWIVDVNINNTNSQRCAYVVNDGSVAGRGTVPLGREVQQHTFPAK